MTKLDKIKNRLLGERNAILAKLGVKDLSVDATETPDPVDLAVRNYSKNVMLAVSENDSKHLVLVDGALARIEDKEYGHCQNCDNKIQVKRINAVPWALYCIDCQGLKEKGLLDLDEFE